MGLVKSKKVPGRLALLVVGMSVVLWLSAFVFLVVYVESPSNLVAISQAIPDKDLPKIRSKVEIKFYDYIARVLRNKTFPGVDDYTAYAAGRLGLRSLFRPVHQLGFEFGPILNDVTHFRYVRNVRPCLNGTKLFVAIVSAPANVNKRNAIRKTWLARLKKTWNKASAGYAFLLGRTSSSAVQAQIDRESSAHGDVIQVDMVDAYFNLTLKDTTLLNWLDKNCPTVHFVLKVDDDVYVNVRNLTGLLDGLSPLKHLPRIYGYKSSSPPLRGDKLYFMSLYFI